MFDNTQSVHLVRPQPFYPAPRTWGVPQPCLKPALPQLLRRLQRLPGNNGEMAVISTQLLRGLQRLPKTMISSMDGVRVETKFRMSTPIGYELRGSMGWYCVLPMQNPVGLVNQLVGMFDNTQTIISLVNQLVSMFHNSRPQSVRMPIN